MDKKRLASLIKKDEGTKLDFKLKLDLDIESGRKELAKDICAIANSKGGRGYLIIGVEDKTKRIVGIDTSNITEEKIQQIVSSRCDPPIPISFEVIQYNQEIKLGVISIYDGGQKPYQSRENGAFYIRRGSTTDTMRKHELIASFQENIILNSELCPIVKSNINYLDISIVDRYFKAQGITVNDENRINLMSNASIIHEDRETGEYMVTLGGLLVFSKTNSIFLPHNSIRVVNKVNDQYSAVYILYGDLISLLDSCENLINTLLPQNYPIEAVFEIVKNAVLYRDYTIFYKEIELIIDFKSIMIISPGNLIEDKNINNHNYLKRNMWIYEKMIILDEKKRFNQARRGFSFMKKAFKNHGKVKFINSAENNCFKVILPGINNFNKLCQ